MGNNETQIEICSHFQRDLHIFINNGWIAIQENDKMIEIKKSEIDEVIEALRKLKKYL